MRAVRCAAPLPPPRPATRITETRESSSARNFRAVSAIPSPSRQRSSLSPLVGADLTIEGMISRAFIRMAGFEESFEDDLPNTALLLLTPLHWFMRAARTSSGRRALSSHSREPRSRRRATKHPQTCFGESKAGTPWIRVRVTHTSNTGQLSVSHAR